VSVFVLNSFKRVPPERFMTAQVDVTTTAMPVPGWALGMRHGFIADGMSRYPEWAEYRRHSWRLILFVF
jgi:hypothetical protein